ncbi:MAG TPA: PaaI family thioesterase [Hyphomicrobiaceae bacterium]|nr:PaaI family thioesterase [Hyphomicrobiaceae bacterium]
MRGSDQSLRGLDAAQVEALINSHFPQIHVGGRAMLIEEAGARRARVRLKKQDRHLRPGGTVSGPTMFTLADFSVYIAIIATLGEAGIDAVTTNLNINFLAKPEPRDLIASVRLLRLGRRLAVGEAQLYSDGAADPVAHAIATYALPSPPRDL